MSEMSEIEKLGQHLVDNEKIEHGQAFGSDIELVDASVILQKSGLPSEAHLSGDQVFPLESNDVDTGDIRMLDAAEPDEGLENRGNGVGTSVGNSVEGSTPLLGGEALTSQAAAHNSGKKKNRWTDIEMAKVNESGTPEERAEFIKDLEIFYKENGMEFKHPKFYGELLNCLKLWRAVIKLGGYELVTGSKLWRQVGESFHPPKTCTTVSWTFRIFYEKALLEYEKHKRNIGELQFPVQPILPPPSIEKEVIGHQTPTSGRARRDAASRAMQGWHAKRNFDYGEDKTLYPPSKRERPLKSIGTRKNKTPANLEHSDKLANTGADKQVDATVIDVGPPADWVKVKVRRTKECFEIYALVPGLLREEVRVQSDPAGRLVITGEPEQQNNPWGITSFKKVVNLPARIDPLQTNAVVSLHGRLSVRAPFEHGSG